MATAVMTSYKRVTGDIEEAERIARLLQEEVNAQFGELQKDFPELTARLNLVKKWNDIVAELKRIAFRSTYAEPTNQSAPAKAAKSAKKEGDAVSANAPKNS